MKYIFLLETKLFQQTNVNHILFLYKSVFVRVGLSSNKWTHGLMLDFGDFLIIDDSIKY